MFTMNIDTWLHRRESDNRLWTSAYKRTRWMQQRDGLNTSYCHTRRMCVEGTSCPSGTRCLDESLVMQNERKCRVRLFRDNNLDSAFSPQYVDADILRMTFKREVNCGLSNPEILNLNVLQERRQDRL